MARDTVMWEDIGKKLDRRNELLVDIKANTSILSEIKKDFSTLPDIKAGIDNLDAKAGSFIAEQRAHNQRMHEHNLRLEKILEKLSQKEIKKKNRGD